MKIQLILFLFVFQAISLQAQLNGNYMVISQNGVCMRAEPDIQSTIITKIGFGEYVRLLKQNYSFEVVDSVKGEWLLCKYLNKEGYIFSPYISSKIIKSNPKFPQQYPLLIISENYIDDFNCTDYIYYDPFLYWYGVFYENKEIILRKITVNLDYENVYEGHKVLTFKPSMNENKLFFIGFHSPIEEHTITTYVNFIEKEIKRIFPGQKYDIFYSKKTQETYSLNATGMVEEDFIGYCNTIKNYKLRFSAEKNREYRHQNLLAELDFLGECYPELYFVGDIDADEIPDIILQASSSSQSHYSLFLSSYGSEQKLLEKVATSDFGNCF
ncbi:MAG: SH3 domain-containing protein [Chitinophagales bacterium]|nr:SH3 domain-containing protein [Bacteroidota bacterium]